MKAVVFYFIASIAVTFAYPMSIKEDYDNMKIQEEYPVAYQQTCHIGKYINILYSQLLEC